MKPTTNFKDKTLMITGGTGSFGNTVLKHFMDTDLAEIRIFSRDEKKQDDMRHRLQEKSPELASKVRFFIGDVRNAQSVRDAMHGVDYIFHAAALKQVPSCEFFPMEAVRTNVIGTDNVLHAAIDEGVDRVVCLSTDKAAYPINAMGKSKAMMESIIYANARNGAGRTTICCTRYGNVMCSRGSVIPLFIDRIRKGEPLTVTDPTLTRPSTWCSSPSSTPTPATCSSRRPLPPRSATSPRPSRRSSAAWAPRSSAPATARSCSRPS